MAQHSSTLQFTAARPPAGERLAEQVGSIRLKVEHDVLHSTLIARGDTRNCMAMILKPHGFEYNRNLKRWERAGPARRQCSPACSGSLSATASLRDPSHQRARAQAGLADFLAEHRASCTAALASDLQDPHGTDEEIDDEWDQDALAQIDAAVAAHAAAPPAAAAAPRRLTPEQQRRIEANKAEALRRRAAAGAAPVAAPPRARPSRRSSSGGSRRMGRRRCAGAPRSSRVAPQRRRPKPTRSRRSSTTQSDIRCVSIEM